MKFKMWYIVINGGDGSAYMQVCESERIAKLKEKLEILAEYNFAESSVGWVSIESASLITVGKDYVLTFEELQEEVNEDLSCDPNNKYVLERKKLLEEYKNDS